MNCALSAWQKLNTLFVILCLLGMRVQIERLYTVLAYILDENSHTCPART